MKEKRAYIYSSVNEAKLANVDGIGPLKLVPRILLQGAKHVSNVMLSIASGKPSSV